MLAGSLPTWALKPEYWLPLEMRPSGHLFVDTSINGQKTRGLFDSAAELTLIDYRFAERAHLIGGAAVAGRGSGKDTFTTQLVEHVRVEAAGVVLADTPVAVVDLSDVGRRLLGGALDVVVGRDVFDAARIDIDIARGRVAPISKAAFPAGRMLPLTTRSGIEVMPVRAEDHTAEAAFDLGNGNEVLVGSRFAERHGLLSDGRPTRMAVGGGLGGAKERLVFKLKALEIAGRTFRDVPAALDDGKTQTELNIGTPQLRHFRIVSDFAAKSLWLS